MVLDENNMATLLAHCTNKELHRVLELVEHELRLSTTAIAEGFEKEDE